MTEDIELVKKERSFYKSWNTVFCFVVFLEFLFGWVMESKWEYAERQLHSPEIENCQAALKQCNIINEEKGCSNAARRK